MTRYNLNVSGDVSDYSKNTVELFSELYARSGDLTGSFNSVPSEFTDGAGDIYYYGVNPLSSIACILTFSSFSSWCSHLISKGVLNLFSASDLLNVLSTGSDESLILTDLGSNSYEIKNSSIKLTFNSDGFGATNFAQSAINTPPGDNEGGNNMADTRKISDVGFTVANGIDGSSLLNVFDNMDLGAALPAATADLQTLFAGKAAVINTLLADIGAVTQQEIDDSPCKVTKMNFPVYVGQRSDASAVEICRYTIIYEIVDPRNESNTLKITATLNGVPAKVDYDAMRTRLQGVYNDTTKVYENGALPELVGPSYKKFVWCRANPISKK